MECSPIPAKVIASCFGLMAFAAALVIGWAVDNTTQTILWRALTAMFACWAIGYGVGLVAQQVVDRRIEAYKAANPLSRPEETASPNGAAVLVEENSDVNPGSPVVAGRIPGNASEPPKRQAS